jgi:hypothetical protein
MDDASMQKDGCDESIRRIAPFISMVNPEQQMKDQMITDLNHWEGSLP